MPEIKEGLVCFTTEEQRFLVETASKHPKYMLGYLIAEYGYEGTIKLLEEMAEREEYKIKNHKYGPEWHVEQLRILDEAGIQTLYCPVCRQEVEAKDVMDDNGPKHMECEGIQYTLEFKRQ